MAARETVRLTGDVVAFADQHVLLIRRRKPPYAGMWALPGGHVDVGERVEDAARRELAEETGVEAGPLEPVGWYSEPGRDPRGRYVTAAFAARLDGMPVPVAADDAAAAEWIPVDRALADGLAFDHARIVGDALRLPSRPAMKGPGW